MYECDDGNMIDGDGCDHKCRVEPYYECKGGNVTNADICINRKPPDYVSFVFYKNQSGTLTFSTYMKISSKLVVNIIIIAKLESVIEITLESKECEPVKWSYVSLNSKYFKKIFFRFEFNHSLIGDEVIIYF